MNSPEAYLIPKNLPHDICVPPISLHPDTKHTYVAYSLAGTPKSVLEMQTKYIINYTRDGFSLNFRINTISLTLYILYMWK